jgi:hypothetical protein
MLYQLSKSTNEVVRTFLSVKDAVEQLQVSPQSIRRAISGVNDSAHGFRWSQKPPNLKGVARARLGQVNAAKELSESLGGHWKDYLEAVS